MTVPRLRRERLGVTSLDGLSGSTTTDKASVTITDTSAGSLGSGAAVADFGRDGRDDLALGALSYSADLDGNGRSELVVSAPYGNSYKGAVYFFSP